MEQRQTTIHKLYNLYVDNPYLKSSEAGRMLGGISGSSVRVMRKRLMDKGFIADTEDGAVRILQPFEGRFCEVSPLSWKAELLRELIEMTMEDIRSMDDPKDKLPYIQEIRAMLKMSV